MSRFVITPTHGLGWIDPVRRRGLRWLTRQAVAGQRVAVVAETINILESVFDHAYDNRRRIGIASTDLGRLEIPAYHSRAVSRAPDTDAVAVFWGIPRLIEKVQRRFPGATLLAVLWHPKYSEELKQAGFQELPDDSCP